MMPYFLDLQKYAWIRTEVEGLCVGWLDKDATFKQGSTSAEFKDKLFECCRYPVHATRGFHLCNLCSGFTKEMLKISRFGNDVFMGNAEIWVSGGTKIWYAAPTLIYHYVDAHSYCPPQAFIDAIMECDPQSFQHSRRGMLERLLGLFSPKDSRA